MEDKMGKGSIPIKKETEGKVSGKMVIELNGLTSIKL